MDSEKQLQNAFLLQQLAEAYGMAFFIYHPGKESFTYLNKAVDTVFGINPAEAEQKPEIFLDAVFPDDKRFVTDCLQQLAQGKEQKKVEFRIIHPVNGIRWICLACTFLTADGETFIAGHAEDFTKEREYLYNLVKFNTKKNATLEILSHDLAAPFANIQGLVELIRKQNPENEKTLKILELIKADALRGSDMIRDFVNNEFLESSQVVLHKDRLDIVHRIQVMIDNYKMGERLINKQFELVVKERPIFLYVDEMKFMQVLNNLISNSIKFTHENGKISISVTNQPNTVLITVKDNGIGIPEDLQPHLFEKFTKARRPGIMGEKSVGMGMSIIRNIVELHNGKIWFESAEAKGTTFYIEMPKE